MHNNGSCMVTLSFTFLPDWHKDIKYVLVLISNIVKSEIGQCSYHILEELTPCNAKLRGASVI